MPITINLGWSKETKAYEAGKISALKAVKNSNRNSVNLAVVFGSANYLQNKLISGIKEIIPDTDIIGCSGASIITPEGPLDNGVAVCLINSDNTCFQYSWGLGKNVKNNSRQAGYQTARTAVNGFSKILNEGKIRAVKKSFLIFPDGVTGNGTDILRGCQEITGSSFSILGCSSADNYMFEKTYQYFPKGIASDSVAGLLIGGKISIGLGIKHGWNPLGKYRTITISKDKIIKEIDNRPAVSIYEDYFGEETKVLKEEPLSMMGMLYPIGISVGRENEYLLRNPFKTTDKGHLVCSAEIPEGSRIRLMISSRAGVINAAKEAAEEALRNLGGKKPKLTFMFSSISRKKLLGRDSYKEIEMVKNISGKDCPVFGFYGYGELAPIPSTMYTGQSYFHNETIVIAMLGE